MTMLTVAGLLATVPSSTISRKSRNVGSSTDGAVKLGFAVVASRSDTSVPEICVH